MNEIRRIIEKFHVSDKVKQDVKAVYETIAEAESHAHGCPMEEIHFHEVGSMDAVTDVTAVCLLLEKLAPEQILVSPIHVHMVSCLSRHLQQHIFFAVCPLMAGKCGGNCAPLPGQLF